MTDTETTKQLKHIKWFIAIGAIGFLLAGLGVASVAAISAAAMSGLEDDFSQISSCEDEEDFEGEAEKLFERGAIEDLLALIDQRRSEYPNDANVYWYTARIHSVRGEWDAAITALDQTLLLSPSWGEEYVQPLRAEIIRRRSSKIE
ncbi:MAG: hypothetical protein V4812_18515 [Pseudomonadota bacterium]